MANSDSARSPQSIRPHLLVVGIVATPLVDCTNAVCVHRGHNTNGRGRSHILHEARSIATARTPDSLVWLKLSTRMNGPDAPFPKAQPRCTRRDGLFLRQISVRPAF